MEDVYLNFEETYSVVSELKSVNVPFGMVVIMLYCKSLSKKKTFESNPWINVCNHSMVSVCYTGVCYTEI